MKIWEFVLRRIANFGYMYLLSTSPLNGNFTSLKSSLKNFERKFCLFWSTFCKASKVYHLDQVQRHFFVSIRLQKNHYQKNNFFWLFSKEKVWVVDFLNYSKEHHRFCQPNWKIYVDKGFLDQRLSCSSIWNQEGSFLLCKDLHWIQFWSF